MAETLRMTLRAVRVEAAKNGEKMVYSLMGVVLSEIDRLSKMPNAGEMTDDKVIKIISGVVKSLEETKSLLAARNDTGGVSKLNTEIEILSRYLPSMLSEEDLKILIQELKTNGAKDKKTIMTQLREMAAGRYDGKVAAQFADSVLAN